MQKTPTLTAADLKPGLVMINTEHPEWGSWVVRDFDSRTGCWEIRGRAGVTVLDVANVHRYAKAS